MEFFELTFNVSDLIIVVGGIIAIFKIFNKQSERTLLVETKLKNVTEKFEKYEEQSPICMQEFSNIKSNIQDVLHKEELYQAGIEKVITAIVNPINDIMRKDLRDYVDIKTGILVREIEVMKEDNIRFKDEIKVIFEENLNRLVDVIIKK